MAEVARKAGIRSYVSIGGDTCKVVLGSENYVILKLNDDIYVDVSFKNRTCTVYDDSPGWNVRQIGTSSGRMVECKTEAG